MALCLELFNLLVKAHFNQLFGHGVYQTMACLFSRQRAVLVLFFVGDTVGQCACLWSNFTVADICGRKELPYPVPGL